MPDNKNNKKKKKNKQQWPAPTSPDELRDLYRLLQRTGGVVRVTPHAATTGHVSPTPDAFHLPSEYARWRTPLMEQNWRNMMAQGAYNMNNIIGRQLPGGGPLQARAAVFGGPTLAPNDPRLPPWLQRMPGRDDWYQAATRQPIPIMPALGPPNHPARQ